MNKKVKDIYILSRINGIGPSSLQKIITAGYDSINALSSDCSAEDLRQYIKGKNQSNAIDVILNHCEEHLEKSEIEFQELSKLDITIYSKWDIDYPMGYKLLGNKAPLFIYTKGNSKLLNYKDSIAIVGSRECTDIGKEVASSTSKVFAKADYNIVSGLAEGIDTAAHEGALLVENGKTTAVVVDVENIFPPSNTKLAEKILDNNGLLIAENPPGTLVRGHLFTARDRMQSALSLGVFPIETTLTGGTMHTVRYAEEQKRLLYVPKLDKIFNYNINNEKAKGIFELLKTKRAEPYDNNDFQNIVRNLNEKKVELYDNQNRSEQLNQENLF